MNNLFIALVGVVFYISCTSPVLALRLNVCGHATYECDLPDGNSNGISGDDLGSMDLSGVAEVKYIKIEQDTSSIAVPVQDSAIRPDRVIPPPPAPSTATGQMGQVTFMVVGGGPQSPPSGRVDSSHRCDMGGGTPWTSPVPIWPYCNMSASSGCTTTYLEAGSTKVCLFPNTPVFECPVGYSANGTSCQLNNPQAVTQDNRQDFNRSGQIFSPVTGDLVGTISGIQGVTNVQNDSLSFISSNAAGERTSLTIVANSGGGSTVTQTTQKSDNTGASYLKLSTIKTDSAGGIVERSSFNLAGSLSTGVSNSAGGASVVAAPVGAISANPSASQNASFPSDYARTGEVAALGLGTKLDALHDDLTAPGSATDPTEPTAADMPGFGETFNNLLGWQLPVHSSSCPTYSLDLSSVLGAGHVYVMNEHCALINDHFVTMNAAMIVFWSLVALFIVLGA